MMLLIFAAFAIAAWIALHGFLIAPKLDAYRAVTGLHDRIAAIESGFWKKLAARTQGAQVQITAFAVSMVPVVGPLYEQISGVDWTKYLPDTQARTIGLVILFAGFLGPMLLAGLYSRGMANAAAMEPVGDTTIGTLSSSYNGYTATISRETVNRAKADVALATVISAISTKPDGGQS